MLRDKYVRVQRMFHSAKGSTWLGFMDGSDGGDLVIIKEAHAHTMEELSGRDARARLRDEAKCLYAIEELNIAPKMIDHWDEAHSSFLVYAPIQGAPLSTILSELARHGLRPPTALIRAWAGSLCAAVQKLHSFGYVSCDIKPSNLIVTEDCVRLIDLELAGPPTSHPTGSMGTPGYSSPQQEAPDRGRSIGDDVYAIGASLLAMATSTDASVLPELDRVVALEASRDPSNPVFRTIKRCIADDSGLRFQSAAAIVQGLDCVAQMEPLPSGHLTTADLVGHASDVGDRILASAFHRTSDHSYWVSHHSSMNRQPGRDLYAGSAGIALYLCALFEGAGRDQYLEEAIRCGRWLWETDSAVPRQAAMPGLYFGECGPAVLYLKLFLLSHDVEWLDRAKSVSNDIRALDVASPDIMTGLAGVGLFHLALWQVSRDNRALEYALDCARELIARRHPLRPMWRFPSGFEGLSGKEFVGFSHGSAGIGYFLAECCLASRDDRLRAACRELADWVIGIGESALADGSGLTWKSTLEDRAPYSITWCHGAPGIARFLLRAYLATGDSAHLDAAQRAARLVAIGAPWVGTTQCHGLAGNLESLVDLWDCTGMEEYLGAARILAENLVAYRTDAGWPSDERSTGCADLMVGEAGIGAAFLRLARPSMPHLVSCAAFGAAALPKGYSNDSRKGGLRGHRQPAMSERTEERRN